MSSSSLSSYLIGFFAADRTPLPVRGLSSTGASSLDSAKDASSSLASLLSSSISSSLSPYASLRRLGGLRGEFLFDFLERCCDRAFGDDAASQSRSSLSLFVGSQCSIFLFDMSSNPAGEVSDFDREWGGRELCRSASVLPSFGYGAGFCGGYQYFVVRREAFGICQYLIINTVVVPKDSWYGKEQQASSRRWRVMKMGWRVEVTEVKVGLALLARRVLRIPSKISR